MTMRTKRESWIFVLTVLSAAASLVSIAASEILLALACLLWIAIRPRPFLIPAYALPLTAFMLTTVLSWVMSPDPSIGAAPVRKFVLFSMGLLASNFVTDVWRVKLAYRVLLITAAIGSVVALVQFGLNERRYLASGLLADDPMAIDRVKGFMGHWMTFSGGQLLIWCAVIPLIVLIGRRWIIPLLLVGVALIFSYTRSAWLGAAAGIASVAFWIPRKQLVRILVPIIAAGLLASPLIYHRIALSAGGGFGPDYGRVELLRVGVELVRAHPLFGVGLNRIHDEFPKYYRGDNLETFFYGHLHNNFMQIAAERGLLCLTAFLWFLGTLYRSFWRFLKSGNEALRLTALSAVSALTGFLVMGLFEFNFGDSEPLILFLFIVSIPFGIDGMMKHQRTPSIPAGSK